MRYIKLMIQLIPLKKLNTQILQNTLLNQVDQTDQGDQTDQTNIPPRYNTRGVVRELSDM